MTLYTERDARDWNQALDKKDAEIAALRSALMPFARFAKGYVEVIGRPPEDPDMMRALAVLEAQGVEMKP